MAALDSRFDPCQRFPSQQLDSAFDDTGPEAACASFEGPRLFYFGLFWNTRSGVQRCSRRFLSSNFEPCFARGTAVTRTICPHLPGTPLRPRRPKHPTSTGATQEHPNQGQRFSKKAAALITHPSLQDESRCPARRAHGPCRRNSTRGGTRSRYPSPGRPSLLAHAISEPPRVGSCRSRLPRYLRVHSHHLGHSEICQVAALVRLSYPRWQPQPHTARAALRRRTPDPKIVFRHTR